MVLNRDRDYSILILQQGSYGTEDEINLVQGLAL